MLRKISTIDFKSSNTTSGKTVLIRVDYNVPVENELVTDDYRILKSIPTIKYCLEQGAKVVLMSHMGRPKGKVNSKYCVSFNSATSALHLACLALGLKKGDIVWTSPNTFVASANCARYCDAIVDFVDIEPVTGLMSIESLKEKLKKLKQVELFA